MTVFRHRLTTHATIVEGVENHLGWRDLLDGPAEPHIGQLPVGEPLAVLWHLSDVHICDAESPARLEYLDRYGDPDSPYRASLGDIGTYRPQEILTIHVAVAMSQVVNDIRHGLVSQRPVDAIVVTGDLTDNAQRNELHWYDTWVNGGTISPRSGSAERSSWVGVSDPEGWDDRYWHPDGAPAGCAPDLPTRTFGYPTISGLIEAARADVTAPGLLGPVINVYGNHDGLLQGTVPADDRTRAMAIGDQRITGMPPGESPMRTAVAIAQMGPALYPDSDESPRESIPADARRSIVQSGETSMTLNQRASNYFTQDVGDIRLIVLDTVNPHGGWQGSLDQHQFEWLAQELDLCRDRYIVISSHHPSWTLINGYIPVGERTRILGLEIISLLLEHVNVIAWLAGHVHHHHSVHHGAPGAGFWEITTASLIDFPQQGRMIEIIRDESQDRPQIAIVSTVVDHGAEATWHTQGPRTPLELAALSRTLAANDYRYRDHPMRESLRTQGAEVRNVVWRLQDPLHA